ncbi:unnamed protein product, partial [Protopolystoma xenopodis]
CITGQPYSFIQQDQQPPTIFFSKTPCIPSRALVGAPPQVHGGSSLLGHCDSSSLYQLPLIHAALSTQAAACTDPSGVVSSTNHSSDDEFLSQAGFELTTIGTPDMRLNRLAIREASFAKVSRGVLTRSDRRLPTGASCQYKCTKGHLFKIVIRSSTTLRRFCGATGKVPAPWPQSPEFKSRGHLVLIVSRSQAAPHRLCGAIGKVPAPWPQSPEFNSRVGP